MKKILSVLLVTLMLLSPFAICVNAEGISASNTNEDKLTAGLKEHLLTVEDDEYVPIYIWLNDYGEDVFYQVLSKKLGTAITADTEEAYISNRIADKESLLKQNLEELKSASTYSLQSLPTGEIDIQGLTPDVFRVQAGISEIMTATEIKSCIESGMSSSEIIALSERSQFLSDYRQARKAVNTSVNESFYKLLDLNQCKNISLDPLLCRVTMECEKSYIDNIESIATVKEIGYFENVEFVEVIETENSTESTYSDEEFHMTPMNTVDGTTYTGTGIKIGIMEVGYYSPSAPHIEGRGNIYNYETATTTSNHATAVLSILAGKPLSYNNGSETLTYQGIAPGATIYFAGGASTWKAIDSESNNIIPRLEWLVITSNCGIINISLGVGGGNYIDFDMYIDQLILNYGVSIIKSAGNNTTQVTSPGLAYNAITVGNAEKLSDSAYKVRHTSCYEELDYLANKPDLCAIGTNIYILNSSCSPEYIGDNGTSFAAPMVAGTAALMMQANPALVGKPDTVKAILLNSADEDAVSAELIEGVEANGIVLAQPFVDNTKIQSATPILREKSGAGLLNIETAIRMSNSSMFYDYTITSYLDNVTTGTYYFPAGTTIEFGLVYEICNNSSTQTDPEVNDIDIRILDANDNIIFTSTDYINNVEMFKCTFAQGGEYRFTIFCWDTDAPINTTLILSCGCDKKLLSHSDYEKTQHKISCDSINGCGFVCYEKHQYSSHTTTLSNGIQITHTVSYIPAKTNELLRDFDYYSYYYEISSPEGITVLALAPGLGSYTQTTATGEIRRCNYEAIIEQNGSINNIVAGGVTITIDYFDKTVTLTG